MKTRFLVIYLTIIFCVLLCTMSPFVNSGDSGEFITNAIILGVNHSPGYPVYSLLGKIFSILIPFGDFCYRINLMNIVFVIIFIIIILQFKEKNSFFDEINFLLVILIFVFSESLWRNAVQTEVFVLNIVFASLIFLLFKIEDRTKRWQWISYVLGFGLGNHHTLLFLFPGLVYIFLLDFGLIKKKLFSFLIFFILGFSVYVFLPLRAEKKPSLNWGEINSVESFFRVILRKDYGTFQLTTSEPLKRNFKNIYLQTKRYINKTINDLSLLVFLLFILSLYILAKKELSKAIFLLITFLTTGLGFILLANLSFEPISDGILERFYILPNFIIIFTILSTVKYFYKYNYLISILLVVSLFVVFTNSFVKSNYREYFLNYDYGKNILNTLPKNSILFMDGGDDTFYTLAYLQFGKKLRQDIRLHDRGGLVFSNVYGKDFRYLTKEEKNFRRVQVEKSFVDKRPLYYSTFNDEIFPGEKLVKSGILFCYNSKNFTSADSEVLEEIYSYRTVYDDYFDYRSRALVPIYYFMKALGKSLDVRYNYIKYSLLKWNDVDWLKNNGIIELHKIGFSFFNKNVFDKSAEVYDLILKFNPDDEYAMLNLGVSFEKMNRRDLARKQYEKVLLLNKNNVNAYYNLAVLSWQENDWDNVIKYFNEILKLQPDNISAKNFLEQAIKNKK
ncbi:MAG: DUF2723 domain-containing protein [Endomicrobiia bacterium]